MFKAVLFDMDGVICDTQKFHVIAWQKVFADFGVKVTRLEVALLEGMSYKETVDLICQKHNSKLSKSEREKLLLRREKIFNSVFRLKFYSYVKSFLKLLKKRGIMTGLVSGSNKITVHKVLDRHLPNVFDVVITGDDVHKGKPSKEPYFNAFKGLNKLGKQKVSKSQVLVIENAPLGIESAKKNKFKVFSICSTLDKKYLLKSDKIFKTHSALFAEVLKNI